LFNGAVRHQFIQRDVINDRVLYFQQQLLRFRLVVDGKSCPLCIWSDLQVRYILARNPERLRRSGGNGERICLVGIQLQVAAYL
jgi:hypothetical protein